MKMVLFPFKSESLHFGVKILKLFFKRKHLEIHRVEYTYFSLAFSCIMSCFSKNWRDESAQILLEFSIPLYFL